MLGEIQELNKGGRPVLVGTISIEKSEHLSSLLKKAGIKHVVLNAKYHEREAEIVAQAGRFGAVTIATNMAGRGTDIILGGVPDHRMKAVLVGEGDRVRARPPPRRRPRPSSRSDRRWRPTTRRPCGERKPTAEERSVLGKRYLGILAAFSPDHPSVQAVSALAGPRLGPRALPRRRARPSPAPPRRRSPGTSIRRSKTPWTSWPSIP